jgi:cytochrome P450
MTSTLTSDDPRYREMFDPAKEAVATSGAVYPDLTPAMNLLRERAPVMQGSLRQLLKLPEMHHAFETERPHYTVFSYRSCERAFRDNLLFSSEVYKESPGVRMLGHTLLEMVGEEHRQHRAVVQPMFVRPAVMSWWKPSWIDDAVHALVECFSERDTAELNLELCARLPMYVVTRGMGLSGDDALSFREQLLRGSIMARRDPKEAARAAAEVARMLEKLIEARRAHPGDDVVSGLIASELHAGEHGTRKLTDEEIFGHCRLIILAGGGTTWRQLGITLHALLTHFHFWQACKGNRELIEAAVEEGARWRPTDPTFPRLVQRDVELEGTLIPAGSRVDLCLGAANRDPTRWDNPDAYDIFRPKQAHLAFGQGPHQCLGINVARQEMITAIEVLLQRFPKMRLDPDAPTPELVGGLEQRGVSALPVRLHG